MTKNHKFAFPDTNIFLHFRFFTEIAWDEVLKAKSVTLVIPPVISRELDKHKYNHPSEKVKERASKVTKKFAEILRSDGEIRPKVNIQFERIEPQSEFEKYNLSKESQDDHFIASIIRFQNESGNKAILITNDFALIVKAHQLNLEVFELTEEYQTKTDENSDKKKIKKLEAELLELKNKIPKLQILFSNDKQILKCKTMSEKNLNDKEIEEEMLMLREEYPKIVIPPSPTLPQVSLKDALIFGGESSFEIILPTGEKRKISPNQARKYNEELNEFYPKLRTYLNEKVKVDKLRIRTFICDIKINNDGTFPAEDIDVFLSFPDFVKLVSEDDRFSYPEIPEPPEFPEHFNAFNYPKNLFRGSSSYVSPISLKNFSQPKIPSWNQKITQKKEGDTANLWIRNLKHGHTKNFERFCVIFSKPENIKSFQILYKITAANLPKQLEGKLNIVVENKKRHSK